MDKVILKYVLQNSIKYGKANAGAIVGKILMEKPELKKNVKEVMKEINKIIKETEKWNDNKKTEEVLKLDSKIFEKKKEKKKELPELENTKNLVMRFAPNPNGPLSLGRSKQALWNWFFVEKYNGEFILRFDDTDPKIKVPMKEAYGLIEEDLKFLKIKISKKIIQSSRLKTYYKYAEELIKKNGAYVCTCEVEEYRKLRNSKLECPCRNFGIVEQEERWKQMFNEFKEGEAVYRVKTNVMDPNPAARDWTGFRIVDKSQHPLDKKSKVWPLLNFASAIDDHELKVTHILRGIDLQISDVRQKYLYAYFDWKYPETIYTGKLIFNDIKSTSKTRELIKQGKLDGWDDPRLLMIQSLKRRGFRKEALVNFIKELGMNKNDVHVSFDNLAAYNKELIDKESNRYFLVLNPVKIKVEDAEEQKVELNLHPDLRKGGRKFNVKDEFYIEEKDYEKLNENKLYRLMDCLNFKLEGKNVKFESNSFEDYKEKGERIMHWVPAKDSMEIEIVMDDNTKRKGFGEKTLEKVKENEVIQAERVGFLRLDKKLKNKLVFYYAHR